MVQSKSTLRPDRSEGRLSLSSKLFCRVKYSSSIMKLANLSFFARWLLFLYSTFPYLSKMEYFEIITQTYNSEICFSFFIESAIVIKCLHKLVDIISTQSIIKKSLIKSFWTIIRWTVPVPWLWITSYMSTYVYWQ